MSDVTVDLETMGNRAGSAIIAIGAVKFDKNGTGDEFYKTIDLQSSVVGGGQMDASTVLWWLKQSEAARAEFFKPGESLIASLLAFKTWLGGDGCKIWGNGASFDNVFWYQLIRI